MSEIFGITNMLSFFQGPESLQASRSLLTVKWSCFKLTVLPSGSPVAVAIPLSSRPYGSGKVEAITGYHKKRKINSYHLNVDN